jgi:hypothetical protein
MVGAAMTPRAIYRSIIGVITLIVVAAIWLDWWLGFTREWGW